MPKHVYNNSVLLKMTQLWTISRMPMLALGGGAHVPHTKNLFNHLTVQSLVFHTPSGTRCELQYLVFHKVGEGTLQLTN